MPESRLFGLVPAEFCLVAPSPPPWRIIIGNRKIIFHPQATSWGSIDGDSDDNAIYVYKCYLVRVVTRCARLSPPNKKNLSHQQEQPQFKGYRIYSVYCWHSASNTLDDVHFFCCTRCAFYCAHQIARGLSELRLPTTTCWISGGCQESTPPHYIYIYMTWRVRGGQPLGHTFIFNVCRHRPRSASALFGTRDKHIAHHTEIWFSAQFHFVFFCVFFFLFLAWKPPPSCCLWITHTGGLLAVAIYRAPRRRCEVAERVSRN